MTDSSTISRRNLIKTGAAGFCLSSLGGCNVLDGLNAPDSVLRAYMEWANELTFAAQRGLLDRHALAQEFSPADIKQAQRPNGVTNPQDTDYLDHVGNDFADYKLAVTGLVARPLSLSLPELKAMPTRTQFTRHDCVEGWSCIAGWTGVPLSIILQRANVLPGAKYLLIRCYDTIERTLSGGVKYYESIDLVDAMHPQTILAYGMNGAPLPVPNGAPLRLRVERQLGYKMAKYVHTIELVESFSQVGRGKGGYWEDRGYEWYAGI